jgi:hypothetical protein
MALQHRSVLQSGEGNSLACTTQPDSSVRDQGTEFQVQSRCFHLSGAVRDEARAAEWAQPMQDSFPRMPKLGEGDARQSLLPV